MNESVDLQGAYDDAVRDLEDTQARLRVAASSVVRLQSEVTCKSTVVQFLGHLIMERNGEVAA